MLPLRDLPIRRKLTIGAMLIAGAALLAALLGCFVLQLFLGRQSAVADTMAMADVVAANAVGPLAFKDAAAADALLAALSARPEIVSASLVDTAGRELGHYRRTSADARFRAPNGATGYRVEGVHVYVSHAVTHEGEKLGRLELTANVRGTLFRFAWLAVAAFSLIFVAALLLVYVLAQRWQQTITAPLIDLSGTARRVAISRDYTLRTTKHGGDEIGELTDAFNTMMAEVHARDAALQDAQTELSQQVLALRHEIAERTRTEAELARTHKDLIEASRRAGQADVATSVLHNVGNVLNSVCVAASLVSERIQELRTTGIGASAKLLRDNEAELGPFFASGRKGRLLIEYLPRLAEQFDATRRSVMAELEIVVKNIDHIKEIVAMQQSYARAGGLRELMKPVEIVEHALALQADGLGNHQISVVRAYDDVEAFPIDKHRVLQILVNLISNAKNALKEMIPAEGRILRVECRRRANLLRVVIRDNGVGISPENLTRIFQHGFTTRRDGHGFGLHSGALTARQLGGKLTAASPGVGLGAEFSLEIPIDNAVATPMTDDAVSAPAH